MSGYFRRNFLKLTSRTWYFVNHDLESFHTRWLESIVVSHSDMNFFVKRKRKKAAVDHNYFDSAHEFVASVKFGSC